MELNIYNGEKFERNKWRYIIFSTIFISTIILSIVNQNIVGGIVLFFILGAYFYYSILGNKTTKLEITEVYLMVDKQTHPRSDFKGYTIEIQKKNIILVYQKGYVIYTINDNEINTKNFSQKLSEYIPLVSEFDQSLLEKTIRFLKL